MKPCKCCSFFDDRLSCESQNDVVGISYFFCLFQVDFIHMSATEGCGGSCHLDLNWNGCGLLLRSARRNFKRIFLMKLLKSIIRLL